MDNFTLRDFSGGLNTAAAEANLPANMTASLANVDFLDSKAISRRSGYAIHTSASFSTLPLDALYRYYQLDGDKYWLAVSGTALYAQQYVSTNVPTTLLEAENATVTGAHTHYAMPSSSGGNCVYGDGQISFPVPYSTRINMVWTSPTSASLKVDSGAWATVSPGTKTWTGLTATAHTVYLKPAARNNKSMKLATSDNMSYAHAYRGTGLGSSGHPRVKFYENGTAAPRGVSVHSGSTTGYGVGISTTYNQYRWVFVPDHQWSSATWSSVTGVTRSTGWHTADFFLIPSAQRLRIYVDNIYIGAAVITSGNWLAYLNAAITDGIGSLYVDSVMRETSTTYNSNGHYHMTLVDDFDSLTLWGTLFTSGTGAITNDTNYYDTTSFGVDVDYLTYSAISAFTKVNTTLTASSDTFAFATLNNNCYISSAYDQLLKYDGSNVTAVTATNTPAVAFMVEKGRRLFGAGSATDPAKLCYTELDTPEDWGKTTANVIRVAGKDAGGNCTGLAVANDYVVYFSESSTYALDTTGAPANWSSKCLSRAHGCIAPKSIAIAPNAVIFLSADGVRAWGTVENVYSDDGSVFTILSDNIAPTLRAYTDAQKAAAVGGIYKNRYWLAIGSDVYVCDLEKRTDNNQPPWTYYTAHDINSLCVTRADEYGLYAGSKTAGVIYRLDYGNSDNGVAIPMLYKTPPLAPKGYTTVKHFKHAHISAKATVAQSITVDVTTDDVSPPQQTVELDSSTDIQPKRLLTPGRGRSAQVRLSSDGLEQPLTISELTMTYSPVPKVR